MLIEVSVRVTPHEILPKCAECKDASTMLQAAIAAKKSSVERQQAVILSNLAGVDYQTPLYKAPVVKPDMIVGYHIVANRADGSNRFYVYSDTESPWLLRAMNQLIVEIQKAFDPTESP